MEDLVSKLRTQVAQIIDGQCSPDGPGFAGAPSGLAELRDDLDRLAQMVAEREATRKALALEVHHRVKNNLQIITSLLDMQASRIENPAAHEALGQTRARIGALALINRVHFEQADDGSNATLDVARLISELCSQFRVWNRSRTEIVFSCNAAATLVPLDNALPLALFAVEAVTNAYAYAFPDQRGGSVRLHFGVTDDGDAVLSVTDDGIGFDSTSNDGSLGRQLMQGFARQLGGSYVIISEAGDGTEARLDYRIGMSEITA